MLFRGVKKLVENPGGNRQAANFACHACVHARYFLLR